MYDGNCIGITWCFRSRFAPVFGVGSYWLPCTFTIIFQTHFDFQMSATEPVYFDVFVIFAKIHGHTRKNLFEKKTKNVAFKNFELKL